MSFVLMLTDLISELKLPKDDNKSSEDLAAYVMMRDAEGDPFCVLKRNKKATVEARNLGRCA